MAGGYLVQPCWFIKGIIGLGRIGSAYAHALVQSGAVDELVLIDLNFELALGLAEELAFAPYRCGRERVVKVSAGHWREMADADIIVIAAGTGGRAARVAEIMPQKRDIAIYRAIFAKLALGSSDFPGVVVIAFDPTGILQLVAGSCSGLPKSRILGCGTVMQTFRLQSLCRELLREKYEEFCVPVAGSGDECFPLWSQASINGLPLMTLIDRGEITVYQLEMLFSKMESSFADIVRAKGWLSYLVADALLYISRAVLQNKAALLTVSSLMEGYDCAECCLSAPIIVNARGGRIIACDISKEERQRLVAIAKAQEKSSSNYL